MDGRPKTSKERWLRAGMWFGVALIVTPILAALLGIGRVSHVPEGLRGATHHPELRREVGFALGSSMLVAIMAPPGVLILVLCGVSLAGDEKKRRDEAGGISRPE
ncbi:MAG TPA: hypothetical protein VHE30_11490 [Polyangiaceae bacterium]|nr:hypothetical protein [Polyangiaceae bacterium]